MCTQLCFLWIVFSLAVGSVGLSWTWHAAVPIQGTHTLLLRFGRAPPDLKPAPRAAIGGLKALVIVFPGALMFSKWLWAQCTATSVCGPMNMPQVPMMPHDEHPPASTPIVPCFGRCPAQTGHAPIHFPCISLSQDLFSSSGVGSTPLVAKRVSAHSYSSTFPADKLLGSRMELRCVPACHV